MIKVSCLQCMVGAWGSAILMIGLGMGNIGSEEVCVLLASFPACCGLRVRACFPAVVAPRWRQLLPLVLPPLRLSCMPWVSTGEVCQWRFKSVMSSHSLTAFFGQGTQPQTTLSLVSVLLT